MVSKIKHVKLYSFSIIILCLPRTIYNHEGLKLQLFCFSASSNQMHFMAIDKENPMLKELMSQTSESIVYNFKMFLEETNKQTRN